MTDKVSTMSVFTPRPNLLRCSIAVLAAWLISGCEPASEEAEIPLRPVRYMQVTDVNASPSRTFSGTSRSTRVSRLSFKVSGTVVGIPVEVGDRLNAGDLLARLDPSSFDLQVQQSQASLVQAQANERNASANYERFKGLYENRNASRNDLDSARAEAESGKAQVRAAQKALELAELNRSYTVLRAEEACSVASVDVEVNENVNAGSQVTLVNCGDDLEIELGIPDSLIASVNKDAEVSIRFDAIADTGFNGIVTEVGITSESGAPTFPVIVAINGQDERLRSGLSADVTFRFATSGRTDAYLLPLSAIANSGNDPFVFVAQADGDDGQATVVKRAVEIGELTELGIEVLRGIRPGDLVVTAGVSVIRDGQRVLLK